MQIKSQTYKIRGMNKDLSYSAFNPEFSWHNHNIRLTARDGSNLLAVTNEKGNVALTLVEKTRGSQLPMVVFNIVPQVGGTTALADISINMDKAYTGTYSIALLVYSSPGIDAQNVWYEYGYNGIGSGMQYFLNKSMTPLQPGTHYYVRAIFDIQNVITAYSDYYDFTTLAIAPTVSTGSFSAVTINSLTALCSLDATGGADVTDRGICWSTSEDPTIAGAHASVGAGVVGAFSAVATGLTEYTMYYVRAYATNSVGTSYGANRDTYTLGYPVVSTQTSTNVTGVNATARGTVVKVGNPIATQYGFVWSTSPSPTLSDNKSEQGTPVAGTYTHAITGLSAITTYYIKAYATNSLGTVYGAEQSFTTSTSAIVTTVAPSSITDETITTGGNISYDGGAPITQSGVCWSTTNNPPTIADSKTLNGSNTGIYQSIASGLNLSTLYYIRAYVTNSFGTAYGDTLEITTISKPTVTTANSYVPDFSIGTVSTGGAIVNTGGLGTTIIDKGVCWGLTSNPTLADDYISGGTGSSSFSSSITSLTLGTTYHIRAYATNSIGTSYGQDVAVKTFPTIGVAHKGGIIAYVDSGGVHGFVSALADQSTGVQWYNGAPYASATTFDSAIEDTGIYGVYKSAGRISTDNIITLQGAGTYAASICALLTDGGATAGDWYLPSKAEWDQLRINYLVLGNFISGAGYWTSTEYSLQNAYYGYSSSSSFDFEDKINLHRIRAIRAF